MIVSRIIRLFGTRLWVSINGLALFVALARILGPEQQGVASFTIMLASTFVMVGCVGLESSTVYFINRIGLQAKVLLRRAAPVLAGSVISIVLLVTVLWSQGYLGAATAGSPFLILLLLCLIPLDISIHMTRYLFQARERFKEFNRMEQYQSLLLLFLVCLSLWISPSAVNVLKAYLASRLFTLLWIVRTIRESPFDAEGGKERDISARELLKFSLVPWLSNISSLLISRMDMILLSFFIARLESLTLSDLGLYTLCMMMINRMQDVQLSINYSFNPSVAKLPLQESKALAAKYYRMTWLIYLVLFIAISILGYPILYVFGSEYVSAYNVLIILSLSQLLLKANTGVLVLYFINSAQPIKSLKANTIALAANISLLFVLIPVWGIIGAALATLGASLVLKLSLVWMFSNDGIGGKPQLSLRKDDLRMIIHWTMERLTGRRS
jgi:O-antigen/teichoic acid export membrane protein